MIMECDTVLQNGVSNYDLCTASTLPEGDCCDSKCYDVDEKCTNKSSVDINADSVSVLKTSAKNTSNAQSETDMPDIRNLISNEVIIDGFSVLSFKTKSDLMLYSDHCEAERRKLASTYNEEDPSKRSKRSVSGRQRRSKLLFKRTLSDRTLSDAATQRDALEDEDLTMCGNSLGNDISNQLTCRGGSPSHINLGTVPYVVSSGPVQSHTIERDFNINSTSVRSDTSEANGIGKISPLRLSRVRKSDLNRSSNHTSTTRRCSPTSGSDPDHDANCSHVPDRSPQSVLTSDNSPYRPSSPRSMLNTARNCHLTPLSVTWNPPILQSSPKNVGEHWTPGARSNGEACVRKPQWSDQRVHPIVGSQAASKPAGCHQFSVAALTDELNRCPSDKTTPIEIKSSPCKVPGKSGGRRSNPLRSQFEVRPSVLNSPISHGDESSLSHSFLSNLLPTVQRSGSSSPLTPQKSHTVPTQPVCNKLLQSPTCTDSRLLHDSVQLSTDCLSGSRSPLARPHHRSENSPTLGSGSSKFSTLNPTSSALLKSAVNSGLASDMSRTQSQIPLSFSSPSQSKQSLPNASAGCSVGVGFNSSHVPVPDPRLLQQMLGVDLNTAIHLLKDPRFKELYYLTMANLTSGDKKSTTVTPPVSSPLSDRLNHAGDNGIPSSVSSSLNALVKLASTDLSFSSVDPPLGLRSVSDSVPNAPSSSQPILSNLSTTRHVDPGRPSNVLHHAHYDRDLASRIPPSGKLPPSSLGKGSNALNHGIVDPVGMKLFPPPPPLTAGYSADNEPYPGDVFPSDLARSRYPSVPPPPPMLPGGNVPPASCTVVNNVVPRPPKPTAALPVTSQVPDSVLGNSVLQSHWELFFRQMFNRPSGPTGFTGPGSVGTDFNARSHSSGSGVGNGAPGLSIGGSLYSPSAATPQPILSFPPGTAHSSTRPIVPPPPMPPPYNLNPMSHSQGIRPSLGAVHGTSGASHTLKPPSVPPGSLLHRPVHPDKSCGRWADAHIRIARFIHLCKSARSSHSSREDRKHNASGIGFPLPHTVVRPIARPDQPHPSNLRPTLTSVIGSQAPRLHSPQVAGGSRQWDCLTHPGLPNLGPSVAGPVGEFEKNPFWNYLMNSVMANLPSSELSQNYSAAGAEAVDMFWSSVLQGLARQNTSTQIFQNNLLSNPSATSGTGKQPIHPYPGSGRSGLTPSSVPGEVVQTNVDHIPTLLSGHTPSNPPTFPAPLNPLRHGPHLGPTNSIIPQAAQMDATAIRLSLDTKRARLDPGSGHFDQAQQTQFPLLQRMSHPNNIASGVSQQHKHDVIQAAASILNGFHGFPTLPSGNAMHTTGSGFSESSGTDGLNKSRVKTGSIASHLGSVHRW